MFVGDREMLKWKSKLLHKCGALSLDPEHSSKKPGMTCASITLSTGKGQSQGTLGACHPVSLASP